MKRFCKSQTGTLVENIIYIIIIGALAFSFYGTKFKAPMSSNMDSLNSKINTWTTVN